MARLRADFWVSAYLRRCGVELIPAMLRRRGSPEAGAILVKLDFLDGTAALYGPTPQAEVENRDDARSFARMHKAERLDTPDAEARLRREIDFDPDLWIVEVESREGRTLLD
ncbi:DUF1491 family protein [Lichenihabitans sp. Uapishka_5]|uniref:DUF1491 family protein n=1 Tax=Lichenihabitans sp. Uapishka_5 TaxID=3037302 RepID=UPI0029E81C47|nr:DUF1491 family protein [Lichenihabitans sp. Uapishka_5]MDX7950425.1 DUF1491 family protein [Lichenihabitans sp. Uapishka_5]